jgi:hypothetical protein
LRRIQKERQSKSLQANGYKDRRKQISRQRRIMKEVSTFSLLLLVSTFAGGQELNNDLLFSRDVRGVLLSGHDRGSINFHRTVWRQAAD